MKKLKLYTHGPWIQTSGGGIMDYDNPIADPPDIRDVAHALSQICRFCGHTRSFYSVAEHSVHVSRACIPLENKRWGLLHDASEAYTGDCPSPFKRMLGDRYKEVEGRLMFAIGCRARMPRPGIILGEHNHVVLPREVQRADMRMLMTEARDLLPPTPFRWGVRATPYFWRIVKPMTSKQAEKAFLAEYRHLFGGMF
jgi:hypothetical protein